MDALTVVLFILGFVLLVLGADWLVRGAANLAAAAGVAPLVIGLTVVAFGTSAPELAVSTQAALQGQADLALGNVVGSNIANILLILGISAVVAPLFVSEQLLRLDIPIMLGVSVLVYIMALDGDIDRLNGLWLFGGIIAYTIWSVVESRRSGKKKEEGLDEVEISSATGLLPTLKNIGLLIVGVALLTLGSEWLVNGAKAIAAAIGVSEIIIGLTVVAFGTSLPELATSVVASMRNERDIAVGNIIGSNMFNLMSVLGLTAIIAPAGVPVPESTLGFDLPVMIAVAFATLPVFIAGFVITRTNGALFLGYYIAYIAYQVFEAMLPEALPNYAFIMAEFVIPLTVVTIILAAVAYIRRGAVDDETAAAA